MGFLANCYQEHCRNDIWPKVHQPTFLLERKTTSEKLCFFWGRVYKHVMGIVLYLLLLNDIYVGNSGLG